MKEYETAAKRLVKAQLVSSLSFEKCIENWNILNNKLAYSYR
jgi:hypothetical protein